MDEGQSQRKRKRSEQERTVGASTSSSIPPEAMGVDCGQYDVFLSFRGLDTRKEFSDHLYHNLLKVGTVPFGVFKDDQSIPIGEEFGPWILNAITQSKISIPVISENYASSKWCLHELAYMMECKKRMSHIVLPIFYRVAPSDVRHLDGNFGKAFRSIQEHFDEKDIQNWRQALEEVSYLHGWESQKFANGHEGELIESVLEAVISKLQEDFQLDVPKELVGFVGPMKEIMNHIDSPSINTQMIGIYGMGGIGKTTLAKCIYNQLSKKFVHASFLPDVRETTKRNGIMHLQGLLISDILNAKMGVSRIDYGVHIIKSRFKEKKVLILLDDIDHKSQLDALARECDWFMRGSLIIVTTRNRTVLDQSQFKVIHKYELNELNEVQALLLFNRHAFRRDHSPEDFKGISRDIISTMGGLPLALQVVGSHLYGKKNREVLEDVWKKLKSHPHKDVQEILQISYDALDDGHKQIFLDIACFFIDDGSKIPKYMWEGCGLYPSEGIEELKLRCLIKVGDHGRFKMHDQLRDLGRSISCRGQPPDERSGPWDDDYKGITRVLREPRSKSWFNDWMRAASSGDSNGLLAEVRWLKWRIKGKDLSLSTTNLRLLSKLSVLDLSDSQMTDDWEGWSSIMASKRLRVLDLGYCDFLTCTPDLWILTQLKVLILRCCWRLEHLHPSIGKLKSLVSLDLIFCVSLKKLPEEVGELQELEELVLDNCDITEIPTSIGSLRKLKKLSVICCTSLRGIPTSTGDLQNLQHLDMSFSGIEKLPSAIGRLKNLQTLTLQSCRRLEGAMPSEIGDLSSLENLEITCAPISGLPVSIRNLSSLQHLQLWGCDKLRRVPQLSPGLRRLSISCQCPRLPQLSSLIHLEELRLEACHLLEDITELPSRLLKLNVEECYKLVLLKLDGCKYLEEFSIDKCSSIERLDLSRLIHLKRLQAEHCNSLVEIEGLEKLEFLEDIFICACNSIKRLLFLQSQCLKKLEAIECNNLVEIRGLEGVKFSKEERFLDDEFRLCQIWRYVRS